jgi:RNA polymerase sigma-70 factor (ECF subfamily)
MTKLKLDSAFIEKCVARDGKALQVLYEYFSGRLYGICLRYTKNPDDAQDVLHDSFIKVFENLKNFRGSGSFDGWMRRIVVNEAINFYRRKKKVQFSDYDAVEFSIQDHTPDIISKLSNKELLELVQRLPDGYQLVFNLYAIEGYKHREIADMLEITENTSKTQYLKAKRRLQEYIAQQADNK